MRRTSAGLWALNCTQLWVTVLEHKLEHGDQAYVLEVHLFDAHLLMSAGYDGQVILWDTAQGSILKK
jgi:WD40 repeat protein